MSEPDKDRAGVVAPPPLIYLGFTLVGLALEYVWPAPLLGQTAQYAVAAGLLAVSFIIAIPTFMQFAKAKTHVDPYKPVTAIIKQGPFRWTRNPLYLGMVFIQLGIAAAVDGIWIAVLVTPTVAVISAGVIAREERYLEKKFGEEYLSYKATVRRWI